MPEKLPTHFVVDIDGVLRCEGKQLPGVPEFFESINRHAVYTALSNNSRDNSDRVATTLRNFGVENVKPENALTSADATARWMVENPCSDETRIFVVGEDDAGLFESLDSVGLPAQNDRLWNGKTWDEYPTDVVVGFDTGVDYKKLAPAYNAIHRGARFVGTNPDAEYRDAAGNIMPANGAALNYLRTTGVDPTVIGKPNVYMPEIALHTHGANKESAVVAVIGDTFEQDMEMGLALRRAGWEVRNWLVLSGVETYGSASTSSIRPDEIFEDIKDITRRIS